MDTQYFLTSSCLANIIQRLCLRTSSDFEALLVGTTAKERLAVMQDQGGVDQIKTAVMIHKIVLVVGPPLRHNPSFVSEVLQRMPSGMVHVIQMLLGWVVGRKDCPPLPSYGDRATSQMLTSLQHNSPPTVTSESLLLGNFAMRSKSSAMNPSDPRGDYISVEYKFHTVTPM